jgi:hypothetical protein
MKNWGYLMKTTVTVGFGLCSFFAVSACQTTTGGGGTVAGDIVRARLEAFGDASDQTIGYDTTPYSTSMPTSGTARYSGYAQINVANSSATVLDAYAGLSDFVATFDLNGADVDGKLDSFVVLEGLTLERIDDFYADYSRATTDAQRQAVEDEFIASASVVDGSIDLTARNEIDPLFMAFTANGTLTHSGNTLRVAGITDGDFSGSNWEYLAAYGDSDTGLSFTKNGSSVWGNLTAIAKR